jgi:predicted CXXCH cytochrome family protein
MEEADATTVLGDFSGASLDHFGVVSRFERRGDRFVVNTEGADGALRDYEVAYTFGFEPLQQYLVRSPDGRMQALSLAWDTRAREAGGQRWFDLNGAERVPPGDVLHWTQPSHNWNAQCAECHSTNLRKGYDVATNSYATTWSELDVGCEACHGPASRHVAWAEAAARGEKDSAIADFGLVARLGAGDAAQWVLDDAAPIAHRVPPRSEHTELETCAPCHARRATLRETRLPGEPLLATHRPALLEPGLYEADGQMRDEVYDYGSFLQSRMHAAGVTCSDCHDPHSTQLRAEGDALCGRCHRESVYATPQHRHHNPDSAGARCVACHMPARTYMLVDVRHDHSFRVPRPDLSVSLGTPNACNDCHGDRDAKWAAAAVARWFPDGRSGQPHHGEALHAARSGAPDAAAKLLAIAADAKQPAIVRASAIAHLDPSDPAALDAARRAVADPHPVVRLAAVPVAERFEPALRLATLLPLLRDPILAVRIDAAQALADVPADAWRDGDRSTLADVLGEYRAAQRVNADLPESHVNLGSLAIRLGDFDVARSEFETALRLAPWFVPAYVNFADLERAQGNDAAAEPLLRRALALTPENADVHYALGLALIRLKRGDDAVAAFARASELAPAQPHYAYVWALSLQGVGQLDRALAVLEAARAQHPRNRDLLVALATLSRDAGRSNAALRYARTLVEISPDDPDARALLAQLEADGRP